MDKDQVHQLVQKSHQKVKMLNDKHMSPYVSSITSNKATKFYTPIFRAFNCLHLIWNWDFHTWDQYFPWRCAAHVITNIWVPPATTYSKATHVPKTEEATEKGQSASQGTRTCTFDLRAFSMARISRRMVSRLSEVFLLLVPRLVAIKQ